MKVIAARSFLFLFVCILLVFGEAQALIIDEFIGNSDPVRSNTQNVTVSKVISSSSAIGGQRLLRATKQSSATGSIEIESYEGSLFHSQGSGVSGITSVLWDAGAGAYDGLGTIDLTQDQGTAFILKQLSFDYPNQKNAELTITIYDASDKLGRKSSSHTILLDQDIAGIDKLIPFSDFTNPGSLGFADFKNVGAIELIVNSPNPNVDIAVGTFMTNGICAELVPDLNGKVIDDCGICGGHNETKDSCGLCPNNEGYNSSKDECGVCFGDNSTCLDYMNVPKGTATRDACGVCNGDGSSCADCLGMPNGPAKNDVCGVCDGDGTSCLDCTGTPYGVAVLDVCGICSGDGTSCIQCIESNLNDLLVSLSKKSKDQFGNAKFFLLRWIKADPKYATASKKEVTKLYKQLLQLIKKLPNPIKECNDNPLCVRSTEHVTSISSYEKVALKLYRKSLQLLIRKQNTPPGKCSGSISECMKRQEAKRVKTGSMKKYAYRLYRDNVRLIRKVPKEISVCK